MKRFVWAQLDGFRKRLSHQSQLCCDFIVNVFDLSKYMKCCMFAHKNE